ncbi:MAG: hypothetical protein ABIH24_11300 [Verrucomicrobiota bacterium]
MNHDYQVIRNLAGIYAEIARQPVNEQRRIGWQKVNDLEKNVRPMVWINEEPWQELNYDGSLTPTCRDTYLRTVEDFLLKTVYRWNHFPVDLIVDPFLVVKKVTNFDEFCGLGIKEDIIGKGDGGVVSHGYVTQFATMDDVEKIRMIKIAYDKTETMRRFALLQEICQDIIEIRLEGQGFIHFTPWDKIAMWYNPMEILMDLVLKPELMHAIVSRYTDAMLYQLDQLEAQNMLSLCNNNVRIGSGGLGYVSDLPGKKYDKNYVCPYNQWGNAMPQIFSDVSPEMHEEFALQYDRKWLRRFGLSYYGCCEPLHNKLGILKSVGNLRKISVSPWANIEKMVSEVGGNYVLSVKPSPACFAEDHWQEDRTRCNLQRLFDITRGLPTEFIIKDISTCRNDVSRITSWCKIIHAIIERN